MGNIKKIDQVQIDLHTYISKTNDQCKINFAWNLFGTDATVIGLILGIFFSYNVTWFNTPIRITTYIMITIMTITIVTLFRWNRTLINSLSETTTLSEGLMEETSDIQGKHSALARDHEKNTERYERLNEQYAVLLTVVGLLNQQNNIKVLGQIQEKQKEAK